MRLPVIMVAMASVRGVLVLATAVGAGVGCGAESLGGHPPLGTGGMTTTPSGGSFGTGNGGDLGTGGGPPSCGQVESVSLASRLDPDILIVMDRSASLADDADGTPCGGGCGPSSKWMMLLEAVDQLVATNGAVNWGLMFFGADDACGVSSGPQVPIGPMSAPAIENALADATPGGQAPTAAAIPAAVGYLQSLTDLGPRYILLVTDGKSGCASDSSGVDGAAENAVDQAASAGVPTFVLAPGVPSDPSTTAVLNQLAQNGGQPAQQGPTAFYTPVSVVSELPSAVAFAVDGCVIPLTLPLPAGTGVAVYGTTRDGSSSLIPNDPTNGWELVPSTLNVISLNGMSCDAAKNGTYTEIGVVYQCNLPGLGLVEGRPIPAAP